MSDMRTCLLAALVLAAVACGPTRKPSTNDEVMGVSVSCRDSAECAFDGYEMTIDVKITNRGRHEIALPMEYLKKRGPTIELTDVTTHRESCTRPNLVDPELLSQMTRLSPGQSTSMEWVITEFELRQFNHENVNVLAHVTVRTKVQSEGRAVEVKGSDVLHIVGSGAVLDR